MNREENILDSEGTELFKEKRKQTRLWTLIAALIIVFLCWAVTEYIIAFYFGNSITSLKEFSKTLPFFITTLLGVIIGSSIE